MKAIVKLIHYSSLLYLLALVFMTNSIGYTQDLPIDKIMLPQGFKISIYAENVPDARSMTLSPGGIVFVGSRVAGKVYAIINNNKDNKADEVITITSGLNEPNGVAFKDGSLYVAEATRIIRFDNIENRIYNPPPPIVINDSFPQAKSHSWKYIAFGPEGLLYISVGAPCNACISKVENYATIMRMNPDGSGLEIYARGVRNSLGFDWNPEGEDLWFTDNGRDLMGDNQPPDELNRAPRKGLNFGFPYCHGINIPDPEFGKLRDCSEFTPPEIELGPHVAALGMKFYTGSLFPAEYKNQIFIAEHGSWNRSVSIGYRITLVRLENNKAVGYQPFAEGWLQDNGAAWGRPVDLQVMPDGALLVSDDKNGTVYRISYEK
ncbi:MAG TPA: sorbosone dehydrogenase [Candidatus Margulisbacteria bacterium]|nr:sorbosone dehydrogenase [Candidatus Margulisiibacteriota bacterium]